MKEGEAVTNYILKTEKASAALKAVEKVVSDGLLVAMALKAYLGATEHLGQSSANVKRRCLSQNSR